MNFLSQMSWQELLGISAGIISFVAYVPYVISIIKKETKPSRSSWWIWSLIGFLILISYYSVGARFTIWVPVVFFICPLLVAILSIKFGEGSSLRKIDKICLLGAFIGLFFWFLFKSAVLALCINIFIDFLGFLPTFKKTYKNPQQESKITWLLFFIGSIINILAVKTFSPSILTYPIYMFVMDIIMLILLFRKNK